MKTTPVQVSIRTAVAIQNCDRCRVTGMQALTARGIHNGICTDHGMLAWMQAGGTTD